MKREQWEIEFDEKFGRPNDLPRFEDDSPEITAYKDSSEALCRKFEDAVKDFIREKINEAKKDVK